MFRITRSMVTGNRRIEFTVVYADADDAADWRPSRIGLRVVKSGVRYTTLP